MAPYLYALFTDGNDQGGYVSEQDSTQATEGAGQVPAQDAEQGQVPQTGKAPDLEAKLALVEKELERARKEAAESRIKKREQSEARQQALEEQQQFKALADEQKNTIAELQARLAELEGLQGAASQWEAHQQSELERIEARKAALPELVRSAIDAATGLEAKAAVLAAFDATKPTVAASPNAGSGSAPSQKDVSVMSRDEQLLDMKENPDRWAKLVNEKARPPTILSRLRS